MGLDFPAAQTIKNLPAMQETRVQSLSREDPLEEGVATHPSILAWRIPWMEKPSRVQSKGSQRVRRDGATNTVHTVLGFRVHREKQLARRGNTEVLSAAHQPSPNGYLGLAEVTPRGATDKLRDWARTPAPT
ncbi:unnamed protein product [Rangifer tarandus platyrhynchus]|uniref:Uncharacterized protein n=1 Tax=Rangifer tarandus platyrhynchus TaxID=3082113 RepID=A0AC59Y739_RANTA